MIKAKAEKSACIKNGNNDCVAMLLLPVENL